MNSSSLTSKMDTAMNLNELNGYRVHVDCGQIKVHLELNSVCSTEADVNSAFLRDHFLLSRSLLRARIFRVDSRSTVLPLLH